MFTTFYRYNKKISNTFLIKMNLSREFIHVASTNKLFEEI